MHMLKLLKYKSTLKEWNKKAPADQTWANFKILFRDTHRAMKKTGELRQQEGLNHTELMNVVSDGVRDAIKDVSDIPTAPPAIKQIVLKKFYFTCLFYFKQTQVKRLFISQTVNCLVNQSKFSFFVFPCNMYATYSVTFL